MAQVVDVKPEPLSSLHMLKRNIPYFNEFILYLVLIYIMQFAKQFFNPIKLKLETKNVKFIFKYFSRYLEIL